MILQKRLLIALSLVLTIACNAQMPGWQHFKRVTITENSGADITNYQLAVLFDSQTLISNNQMNADGSDLRFSDDCGGTTLFNYWIESGLNTATTKVWVKIDTLLANQTRTIYMHHGNAGASAASAIIGTFTGPHSSTDSVASGGSGGATNSQRGFRFAVNEDILFSHIGKREPNGSTRYVTLFDHVSQAILYQGQVSGPAAQYSYTDVTNPFWLTQGTQYVIELYQGSSDGYYFGPSSQIGQHLTYGEMLYCNSCTQNTFPTNSLTNYHYGYPDFWYFTKNNVNPAPSYVLENTQLTGTMADMVSACANDTISLDFTVTDGEGSYSFSWMGEGLQSNGTSAVNAVPVSDTTTYFIYVSDACAQILADSIHFYRLPAPVLTVTASQDVICEGETSVLTVSGAAGYVWDDMSTGTTLSVSPSVTTSYGVTGTDSSGCVNTTTFELTVNVPLTGTQNISLCNGETFSYNQHVYSQSGTYTDTIAGVTSCDSIVTTTLAIAAPVNVMVQQNGITLSAAAGATSYQWIDCSDNSPVNGATAATFTPMTNGDYAVVVTEGSCSDTSNCFSISTIGLDELSGSATYLQVSPNPNNGTFQVTAAFDATATVHDAAGKVIATVQLKAGQPKEVTLPQVEKGIYFLSAGNKTTKLSITK